MTHQEKIDHLIAAMRRKGISPFTAAPPIYRLFWRIGINVPPPFFQSFFSLFLIMGVGFGVGWGVLMRLAALLLPILRLSYLGSSTVFAGLLFGCAMAAYFKRESKRLKLPPWNHYPRDNY